VWARDLPPLLGGAGGGFFAPTQKPVSTHPFIPFCAILFSRTRTRRMVLFTRYPFSSPDLVIRKETGHETATCLFRAAGTRPLPTLHRHTSSPHLIGYASSNYLIEVTHKRSSPARRGRRASIVKKQRGITKVPPSTRPFFSSLSRPFADFVVLRVLLRGVFFAVSPFIPFCAILFSRTRTNNQPLSLS